MADGFHEMPVRGKRTHNSAPPDATGVSVLPAVATNLDPAFTEGNLVLLSTDLAGNLRVTISGSDNAAGTAVDVVDRAARINGLITLDAATLAALESVDLNSATRDDLVTRLTASINAQTTSLSTNLEDVGLNTATRDDLVTRLTASINAQTTSLSTNLESVDLNAATLAALERTTPQVRGADVDDTNPLPVNIQTNPGTLVDTGLLSSANLAPGATVDLDGAVIPGGVTGRLVEMTAASSVRIKVTLRRMGTGAADVRVFFVDPSASSLVYTPVDRDAITAAAAGRFRVSITNLDNLRTADVYASLTHVEV